MKTIQTAVLTSDEEDRKCIACGYNLRGLGDEPRCPECGLLNVPEALRKQVQQLVDLKPWFFSSFLAPFEKRLPGWWWSLEREDDVRRSFKFAGIHILVALFLVVPAGIIADSVLVESTTEHSLTNTLIAAPKENIGKVVVLKGLADSLHGIENTVKAHRYSALGMTATTTVSTRVLFDPSIAALGRGLWYALWVVLVWAVPALIGICTQIRKGLPEFAKAPRTITAAANYEAHRVTYLAIILVIAMAVDTGLRVALAPSLTWPLGNQYDTCVTVLILLVLSFAMMSWIGPLRSDYTRQLIRSWFHGLRIILMYALFFPAVIASTVAICTRDF